MPQLHKRSPWFIQRSVIFALFLRELKTRFETPGQYVWAVLEPLMQILFFLVLVIVIRNKGEINGISAPMFLLTGFVPWQFFKKSVSQGMAAITGNRGLFFYRQVKPIDTIIARIFLEWLVFIAVYLVLLFLYSLIGWAELPRDLLKLFVIYSIFAVFVFSFSLLISVLNFFYSKFVSFPLKVLDRVLYFTSGIFFPLTIIPQQYRDYLYWNPILHILELSRNAYFDNYDIQYGNWFFMIVVTLVLFVVSMAYYRVNRYAMLNPST